MRQIATCAESVSSSGFQREIIAPSEILKWNPPPKEAGDICAQVIHTSTEHSSQIRKIQSLLASSYQIDRLLRRAPEEDSQNP